MGPWYQQPSKVIAYRILKQILFVKNTSMHYFENLERLLWISEQAITVSL